MEKLKGRIVEINKYQNRAVYLQQGIKGNEQYKYDNYPGGNGTYVTGGEYFGTSLDVKIFVFDLEKCFTIDVYEDILRISGKKRISSQMLSTIEGHKGHKIDVFIDNNNVYFDAGELLL